jgi:FixJ family two-component response regulator
MANRPNPDKISPPDTDTVLVVDDDNDARAVISRMVAPAGVNVIEAANGRQALSILKKTKVSVVISDLVMPRMSGLMLLHSLLEQGHQVPFILITGYSDKDSAIQALRLGAFDYLEKPLHETDLLSVLNEALLVSHEQAALLAVVRGANETLGLAPADRTAEFQIMRMRTFRFKGETYDYTVSRDNVRNWHDLKELFVHEAEPQLVFSDGCLKSLLTSENLGHDLGFVLRVIQSIRQASEATRLNDIAQFAWALEANVAALKLAPCRLSPDRVQLLVDANGVLQKKVAALADQGAHELLKRLDDETERLRTDKREDNGIPGPGGKRSA